MGGAAPASCNSPPSLSPAPLRRCRRCIHSSAGRIAGSGESGPAGHRRPPEARAGAGRRPPTRPPTRSWLAGALGAIEVRRSTRGEAGLTHTHAHTHTRRARTHDTHTRHARTHTHTHAHTHTHTRTHTHAHTHTPPRLKRYVTYHRFRHHTRR